jgi:hypothetical protein
MTLKNRLDKLGGITPGLVAIPTEPTTRALAVMLMVLERREHPVPSEHLDMPQVIARRLLDRDDASPEARETARRFLAGEHDY